MIKQNKNLQLIQVLRGVASLLVVLLHATINLNENGKTVFLLNFFSFGGAGVDIFFVISGFIITYTSFKGAASIKNFLPFISRRVIRIFPTYWIIITGFLLLQILLPSFYRTHYTFNFQNVLSTYFLFPDHNMVNGVSWTLSYELFFYLLFSVVFIIPNKKWTLFLFAIYTLTIILLPILGYNFENGNKWINLLTFPMNVEFSMGVLAALIIPKLPQKLSVPFIVAGSFFFIFNGVLSDLNYQLLPNAFNRVVWFGIPSFFIIAGLVKFELNKILNVHNVFLSLGEASYSLYIVHLPIIAAAIKIIALLDIQSLFVLHLLVLIIIVIVCFFSVLFFKWVEKPIINKLNALRGNSISLPSVTKTELMLFQKSKGKFHE